MCQTDKNLLQDYIDGEMEDLAKVLLEEHLRSCGECRRELNRLKIMDWDLKHYFAGEKITVPRELVSLRRDVTRMCLAQDQKGEDFTWKDIYSLQVSTLNNTLKFIHFIPGITKKQKMAPPPKKKKKTRLLKIMGL